MKKFLLALLLVVLFPVISHAANYALEFDGANDMVEVPASTDWILTGNFTVLAGILTILIQIIFQNG